ncbi:serine protease [Yoonia sp. SS1-5]|uniref:Serine protease n=1 Tax=Yoonia rhodophyticola TaxID=3137370 RepID=A0AAN0NJL5_9RHOB
MRTLIALTCCLAGLSAPLWAQADRDSARSVVQIRCATANGDMKATGFVWPEPGMIVTALHAVAGCGPGTGVVYSENFKDEVPFGAFVKVDLEADLALIQLQDDMGLPAVTHVTEQPNTRDPHVVWGYPLSAREMIDKSVEFAGGLSGGTTTLGRAFSSRDLSQLFRDQDYPTADTQILRVTSTIQPGHSGAPIFDEEGRVVAIADGGLLGGWRGINWSIPAHIYLTDLLTSDDPFPEGVSTQASLFSAYAVQEPKIVRMGAAGQAPADAAEPDDTPATVSIPTILDAMAGLGDDKLSWLPVDLAAIRPDENSWDDLRLQAHRIAGAPIPLFAPETAQILPAERPGFLEARSADGAALQISFVHEGADFDDTLQAGSAIFFARLAELGVADAPTGLSPDATDAALEYASQSWQVNPDGRDTDPFMDVTVQVNGPTFSGQVVYFDRGWDDVAETDELQAILMWVSTEALNTLASLPFDIADAVAGTAVPPAQISELRLVRRVPLADIAALFVERRDFGWKRRVVELKALLDSPQDYADLAFDVYEDRITGGTIAVPADLELVWDPALQAAVGQNENGQIRLAVALQAAADFQTAFDEGATGFLEGLTALIDWDDRSPMDCDPVVDPIMQTADCWDYFAGKDPDDGEFADLYLALNIRGNQVLGTAVYAWGDRGALSRDEEVMFQMMLIGAEYLSDFAEK